MLLNQIARGDDTATARLYAAYQPLVYGYVRAQVWDDPHAVEEIVGDTLLVAFRKADAYTGVSEFSTWLCGIAKNQVADWWRKYWWRIPTPSTAPPRRVGACWN